FAPAPSAMFQRPTGGIFSHGAKPIPHRLETGRALAFWFLHPSAKRTASWQRLHDRRAVRRVWHSRWLRFQRYRRLLALQAQLFLLVLFPKNSPLPFAAPLVPSRRFELPASPLCLQRLGDVQKLREHGSWME